MRFFTKAVPNSLSHMHVDACFDSTEFDEFIASVEREQSAKFVGVIPTQTGLFMPLFERLDWRSIGDIGNLVAQQIFRASDDIYCVVCEFDHYDHEKAGGSIIMEQYCDGNKAGLQSVKVFRDRLGDKYGKTRIAKLQFIDE